MDLWQGPEICLWLKTETLWETFGNNFIDAFSYIILFSAVAFSLSRNVFNISCNVFVSHALNKIKEIIKKKVFSYQIHHVKVLK